MTSPTQTDQTIARACDSMQGNIGRADSKASLLLALDGALLAVITTTVVEGHPVPPVARVAGSLALIALGAAAVLLLLAVRPRTHGQFTAAAVIERQDQEHDLEALCSIATTKYHLIRQRRHPPHRRRIPHRRNSPHPRRPRLTPGASPMTTGLAYTLTNPTTSVRGMTVRQPWAAAISHWGKHTENRVRAISYTGLVLIHAAKTPDAYALKEAPADLPNRDIRGAILAVAHLTGCHHATKCPQTPTCRTWGDTNVWHWTLTAVHPLTAPVPARGALPLWHTTPELRAAVAARL